jgi:carbon-monoxide dehydrogenase small subunit
MSNHTITVTVNGQAHTQEVASRLLLVHFIRENLDLTGTHIGCDTTSCGACTVMLNGRTVKSCTVFAVQANGGVVETIEGVANGAELHPLQEVFGRNMACNAAFALPA